MEPLLIEATFTTPTVRFLTTGELFIKGRSLPEDSAKFYNPIFDWIRKFTGPSVTFDIRFEYLNTSSSKQVLDMLILLKNNHSIKSVQINWHYEEGDEEYYEFGKEMESITMLDFNFLEYSEAD
jgi:hypothetical protein